MNENYLKQITSINLNDPTFGKNLNDRLDAINNNFEAIVNSKIIQGDPGAGVKIVDFNILNESGGYTEIGQLVRDAIFGDDENVANSEAKFKENYKTISGFTLNTQGDYPQWLCSASMFIFIDACATDNLKNKGKDYSTVLFATGFKDKDEISPKFNKYDIQPTLYLNKADDADTSGEFCWKINGIETGITAQGVKGLKGIDGSDVVIAKALENKIEGETTKYIINEIWNEEEGNWISGDSIKSFLDRDPKPIVCAYLFNNDNIGNTGNIKNFGGFTFSTAEKVSETDAITWYLTMNPVLDFRAIISTLSLSESLNSINNFDKGTTTLRALYIPAEKPGKLHGEWATDESTKNLGIIELASSTDVIPAVKSADGDLNIGYNTKIFGKLDAKSGATITGGTTTINGSTTTINTDSKSGNTIIGNNGNTTTIKGSTTTINGSTTTINGTGTVNINGTTKINAGKNDQSNTTIGNSTGTVNINGSTTAINGDTISLSTPQIEYQDDFHSYHQDFFQKIDGKNLNLYGGIKIYKRKVSTSNEAELEDNIILEYNDGSKGNEFTIGNTTKSTIINGNTISLHTPKNKYVLINASEDGQDNTNQGNTKIGNNTGTVNINGSKIALGEAININNETITIGTVDQKKNIILNGDVTIYDNVKINGSLRWGDLFDVAWFPYELYDSSQSSGGWKSFPGIYPVLIKDNIPPQAGVGDKVYKVGGRDNDLDSMKYTKFKYFFKPEGVTNVCLRERVLNSYESSLVEPNIEYSLDDQPTYDILICIPQQTSGSSPM